MVYRNQKTGMPAKRYAGMTNKTQINNFLEGLGGSSYNEFFSSKTQGFFS